MCHSSLSSGSAVALFAKEVPHLCADTAGHVCGEVWQIWTAVSFYLTSFNSLIQHREHLPCGVTGSIAMGAPNES